MQGGNATLLKKEREAFPQKGEQTERTNHPVDGSPERFCRPPGNVRTARLNLDGKPRRGRLSLHVNRAVRRDLR